MGRLRVTVLGCGSSPGVPRIGGDWGKCDPDNPKNRRRRCSILVQTFNDRGDATNVLVDTSPDMREQVLDVGIKRVDGVLYTHAHADHIHGIDDLRAFWINTGERVDIYADQTTMVRLHEAFGYCFKSPEGSFYPPILQAHDIRAGEPVTIDGAGGTLLCLPFNQRHGSINSLGFRFGGLAYSPDVSDLDADAIEALQDLDVWIVDALRDKPHPSHFSLREALDWIDRIKPKRAILTHMHVDLDYETMRRELPAHVEPAYDGLVIDLGDERAS
jgi:phosphoribosyl 1,2-cyclic phosphate phosphodiesterase